MSTPGGQVSRGMAPLVSDAHGRRSSSLQELHTVLTA